MSQPVHEVAPKLLSHNNIVCDTSCHFLLGVFPKMAYVTFKSHS